jgi:hypothetical protein
MKFNIWLLLCLEYFSYLLFWSTCFINLLGYSSFFCSNYFGVLLLQLTILQVLAFFQGHEYTFASLSSLLMQSSNMCAFYEKYKNQGSWKGVSLGWLIVILMLMSLNCRSAVLVATAGGSYPMLWVSFSLLNCLKCIVSFDVLSSRFDWMSVQICSV